MDEQIAEYALKILQKKEVVYAEARLIENKSTGLMMKNGIVQIGGFETTTGIGLRFLTKKGMGFTSTNILEKDHIKKLVNESINKVKKTSKLFLQSGMSNEKTHKAEYKIKPKKPADDVSIREKVEILKSVEKEIETLKTKTGIDVPGRYFSLSDSTTEKVFINTEGTRIKSTLPRINFHYYLTIADCTTGESMQRYKQYGACKGYEAIDEWKLQEKIKQEIISISQTIKHGIKYDKKTADLIVGPEVVGIMCHESVGHPYEADRILGREGAQAGESFVKQNMLRTRIGSSAATVVDDPTLPNSFGYYLYDDEGVKARRRYLMKNGIINEFLHNRETSHIMGVKSNGAARANAYNREPIVRMANTFLLPGDYSEEELISETRNGIYMKNFTEWNIDDKRYNQKYAGCECWLIKNGKLLERLKNIYIEITTPVLWSSVEAVANNTEYCAGTCGKGEPMQGIPVLFGGPSMRLKNIRPSQLQQ